MLEEWRTVSTPGGGLTYLLTVKAVKNLNLRVRPDGTAAVSASRRVPKAEVDRFVASRGDWILSHQARLAQRQTRPAPVVPGRDEALPVLAAALARALPLVAPWGVARPELRCRKMTSRWGSCHFTKGVVVLNTALAAVPEPLLDYVTLHELVHFLHPDHGPGFRATLTSLMPDWQTRRRALREFEPMLRNMG